MKLNRDSARIVQLGRGDFRRDAWRQRIVQIHYYQTAIAEHVGVSSSDRDAPRTVENSIWIEAQRALQKIVARIAVEQRAHSGRFAFGIGVADNNEAFILVSNI